MAPAELEPYTSGSEVGKLTTEPKMNYFPDVMHIFKPLYFPSVWSLGKPPKER
jgi:hypothetical protein